MQALTDAQDTDESWFMVSPRLGLATGDQLVPSHDNTNDCHDETL
jgi:hypothetical protein